MYMRTGSVVRPVSSTAVSTATASSVAVSSSLVVTAASDSSKDSASGAVSCTSMPMSLIIVMMSSICSGSTMSSGR